MNLADFDYHLPPEKIAQRPLNNRTRSRLMVLRAPPAPMEHLHFHQIGQLLRPGDVLVLNDTRVIRARLFGRRKSGGRVEIFIDRLGEPEHRQDHLYLRPAQGLVGRGRVKEGEEVLLPHGARVRLLSSGKKLRDFFLLTPQPALDYLARCGQVPLPPYIRRPPAASDGRRYQTVFARQPGAVAAPTAGLHFSRPLLRKLQDTGVKVVFLTLHVGAGTFLPLEPEQLESRRLHLESFEIPEDTAGAVNLAKREGRRVIAVGTTVVRALETAAIRGEVQALRSQTDLFIQPGFRFRIVDAMITNFHLPRSSLLVLVAAFAGRERILEAYRQAVEMNYRFYSYGDAMFLEKYP